MAEAPRRLQNVLSDRYRIERELGRGGMATVYLAKDLKHPRSVAIKVLDPELAAVIGAERFLREIEVAAPLSHPHILPLHDSGSADGLLYYVMPYAEGESLRQRLEREKQLPLADALRIAREVAGALDYAHRRGLVHRDIKPENILFLEQHAVVADFGIARALVAAGAETLTATGVVIGTPSYMSPEQTGGSRSLDGRSDLYSLGCVLYEMLAGQPPFTAATAESLTHQHLSVTPRPVRELRPTVPEEIERAITRTLAKAAADRFGTAAELAAALTPREAAALAPEAPAALAAAPTAATAATTRSMWRRVALGGAAVRRIVASVVVLLFLMGSGLVWRLEQADYFWRNPLAGARTERLTDFEGDEVNPAISPDGKFMTFLSDRAGQFDVWLSQIGSGEFVNVTKGKSPSATPAVIRKVGFTGDGSQIWISEGKGAGPYPLSLASVLGGDPRPFLANAMEPAWSPDGSMLVYHTVETGDPIFVANRDGRNPKRIFVGDPGTHCHHLTWSPDGHFVYFVKGFRPTDEMDIWRIPSSVTTLATPERITTHGASVCYLAWLDARTLIYSATAQDGSGQWLYALDVKHRIPHRVSSGITEQYISVAVSTTHPRRLIASVALPSASLWTVPISDRIQTEAEVSRLSIPSTRALSPSAAPGYLLFLSSKGGADGLWKLKEGIITELWKGNDGGVVAAPAISRDGARICFSYRQQGRSELYLMDSTGANVRLLTDSFDVRGPASWSPDGKWVAVAGNDGKGTYVFKVPVEAGLPVRLTDSVSYNPIWSPDGQMIVYSEPLQGSTFLTKAITPDKVRVPLPDIRVSYLVATPYRFLPDGTSLIFAKESAFAGVRHFYIVNLKTGQERQLTDFKAGFQTRSFDVMPDGKQIIFDRLRENADIVLIDLAR